MRESAILLLSGGLDSATTLAIASQDTKALYALSFYYGQKNKFEAVAAANIAADYNVREHRSIEIDLRVFGGSSLTSELSVEKGRSAQQISSGIPATYVPCRNTIFLSYALAWAEVLRCFDIFIGVNAVDYSGYPDCRPEYISAFTKMANLATAFTTQNGQKVQVHAPLISLSKGEIIRRGLELGVDYSKTISCYDPTEHGISCGLCDACQLRRKGFSAADAKDPLPYVT